MILVWLIPAILYALIAMVTFRLFAGHIAWQWTTERADKERRDYPSCANFPVPGSEHPNGDQWFGALCLGLLAATMWPLTLLFVKSPVKIGAEREAERRKMQARIKELEKEAGL